jgi:putative cell wall-binding protein
MLKPEYNVQKNTRSIEYLIRRINILESELSEEIRKNIKMRKDVDKLMMKNEENDDDFKKIKNFKKRGEISKKYADDW